MVVRRDQIHRNDELRKGLDTIIKIAIGAHLRVKVDRIDLTRLATGRTVFAVESILRQRAESFLPYCHDLICKRLLAQCLGVKSLR